VRIVQQVDTGSSQGLDSITLESDNAAMQIEIIYNAHGFEVRVLGQLKLLVRPMASNAIEIRGEKY